jgi:DNA-binding Lrp family transcriptional regulator
LAKLKDLDYSILFELMKNSKTSDRQLAKKIGVSQPTVTRRRKRLEDDVLDGYTAIPRWAELGYNILAVTLVKAPLKFGSEQMVNAATEKSLNWLERQPNVIFGGGCRGFGMTGLMISIHRTYSDLDKFLGDHRQHLGDLLDDVQTIIVNLKSEAVYRPLHLKYLAEEGHPQL